ncbi:TRAP transporter substrate-binding protein DctP [Georgenia daeguensis]|uniref:TRAP transporter substrate-binding protein n=1 Tax=Georgenia daeguensis TaxID=908355 RepID=A0ABP6ULQ7_9MICO
MKKSSLIPAGAAAGAIALVLAGCSSSSAGSEGGGQSEVTISYASFVDAKNPHSLAFQEWADQVTEATDGAVTFEPNYNGSLCAAGEIVSCVGAGTADMGFTSAAYEPSLLPITMLGTIGVVTNDAQAQADAGTALYEESEELQAEFEGQGIRLMFNTPAAPNVLASAEEVADLDALDGSTIRAAGEAAIALEKLGVSPVNMAIAEVYESIERGVISGIQTSIDGISSSRLFEVAPHIYDVGEYMGNGVLLHTVINQDVWDSLSPEAQDAMTAAADDVAGRFVADFARAGAESDCTKIIEAGGTVQPIGPSEDGVAWAKAAQEDQIANWVEDASGAIDDPRALFDRFVELVEERESGDDAFTPAGVCMEMQGA